MKKVLSLFTIIGLFFFGCNSNDYQSCPEEKYYDIQGVQLSYPRFNPEYNYGYNPADSLAFKDFSLDVIFDVTYYSFVKPQFSLIPAALATTPCLPSGYLGSEEKLAAMYLITVTDLNQQFKAGDTLNAIATTRSMETEQEISFNAYLEKTRTAGIKDQSYNIRLLQKPDPKVKQAFRLVLKLQNGESYTAETKPIKIF